MNKNEVYQNVINTIIDALEKGLTGIFEMPWHGVTHLPENALTEKRYKGVNVPYSGRIK